MGTGWDRARPSEIPSRPVLWTRSPIGPGIVPGSRDCPGTLALLVVGCRLEGNKSGGIKLLLYSSYKHFFYVQ